MKKQVGNGSVSLLVRIVIGNILGDEVLQLDVATAHEIHNSEGRRHDLSYGCNVILCLVGDFHIVQLIGIAQISIVFPEDDVCFIGDGYAAAGNGALNDELLH